jgi:hypothetical protein
MSLVLEVHGHRFVEFNFFEHLEQWRDSMAAKTTTASSS